MYWERDKIPSNITPMFLTLVLIFIDSSSMFTVLICSTFLSIDFDLINITVVFFFIRFKMFDLHPFTYFSNTHIHFLMAISEFFGLRESVSCVSSAYRCIGISRFCGIWNDGDVYTGHRNSPRTDP